MAKLRVRFIYGKKEGGISSLVDGEK